MEAARELGAKRTYLTHLTHRLDHAALSDWLPDGIEPAWDGLVVEVPIRGHSSDEVDASGTPAAVDSS